MLTCDNSIELAILYFLITMFEAFISTFRYRNLDFSYNRNVWLRHQRNIFALLNIMCVTYDYRVFYFWQRIIYILKKKSFPQVTTLIAFKKKLVLRCRVVRIYKIISILMIQFCLQTNHKYIYRRLSGSSRLWSLLVKETLDFVVVFCSMFSPYTQLPYSVLYLWTS